MVAAAIIGAGALSAGASLFGSSQASSAAKSAADQAQQRYYQTRADLSPFTGIGSTAATNALALAQGSPTGGGPDYVGMAGTMFPGGLPGSGGPGTPGGGMTQAELEATPGYQFTRDQGLKMTQSAAAARGLGVSGASLKGAAAYATGLADKTYLDQFNVAQQKFGDVLNLNTAQQGNLTNQFNRYNALAGLGESAAAGTGTIGASLANTAGNYLNQAGLASAAGTAGVGNAITGAVNNYLGYNALQQYLGGGSGPTSGYTPASFANPTQYTTGGFNAGNVPITGPG